MGCFDRSPRCKSGVNVRFIHCEHTFGAWWVVGCSGPSSTHAHPSDNVRVQSATQWTASVHTLHMPTPVTTFRSCSKCHAMDCFGTYFTHAQTCDNVRVQSATQWTVTPCVTCFYVYAWPVLRHVDFSLSFMFEITGARCYVMSHLLLCVHMGHSLLRHVHICITTIQTEQIQKTKITRKKF